ncbi:MAG: TatD family hydrolase [Prosthecobacter sp.]
MNCASASRLGVAFCCTLWRTEEMVEGFVELGGYFSFSPYFAHPRKAAQRAVFARVPPDRLLAETDAPDMRPPDDLNLHPLTAADGGLLNHPANLRISYRLLAEISSFDAAELESLVEKNYRRLFGET